MSSIQRVCHWRAPSAHSLTSSVTDAVLDAMGYHASGPDAENNQFTEEPEEEPQSAAKVSAQVLSENMSLGDSITVDSESKPVEADFITISQLIPPSLPDHLVQFAQDLLISAGTPASEIQAGKQDTKQAYAAGQPVTSKTVVVREIARRLNSLSLDSESEPTTDKDSDAQGVAQQEDERLIPRREGFTRGQSEPPAVTSRKPNMSLTELESPPSYSEQEQEAYTWEWGGFPTKTPGVAEQGFDFSKQDVSMPLEASKAPQAKSPKLSKIIKEDLSRRNSIPVVAKGKDAPAALKRPGLDVGHAHTDPVLPDEAHSKHTDGQHGHLGKLKNDEDDPYKFMLDTPSVCHTFELSLCAPDDDTDDEVSFRCPSRGAACLTRACN